MNFANIREQEGRFRRNKKCSIPTFDTKIILFYVIYHSTKKYISISNICMKERTTEIDHTLTHIHILPVQDAPLYIHMYTCMHYNRTSNFTFRLSYIQYFKFATFQIIVEVCHIINIT